MKRTAEQLLSDIEPIRGLWIENLREAEPGYLLGRLTILGVDHHVELLEVEIDPETKEMRPVAYYGEDGVGSIGNHNGQRYEELCRLTSYGVHETVSLDGREWVLYVTPFGD